MRKQLLEHFLAGKKLDESVNLESLAKQMVGFTGADIEAVCNESGIVALMHGKKRIDRDSLEEAFDKKVFNGNRSKSERYADDKNIVAYHEAGHAVMSYLLGEEISRASIIGTTSGVGGAVHGADKDSVFVTKSGLINKIKIAFGGRASEEIKFTDVTTGASNDITQATKYMRNYIYRLGFDENYGLLDIEVLQSAGVTCDNAQTEYIAQMSKRLYEETIVALRQNYALVEALAKELLEKETMSGREVEGLLDSIKVEGK